MSADGKTLDERLIEPCPEDGNEHDPLASDEGGPVHCRKCQTLLRPADKSNDG